MVTLKLIPHLLSWVGIVIVLMRGLVGRRTVVAVTSFAGFALGGVGTYLISRSFPVEHCFGLIRGVVGGSFLLLWGISVAALYGSTAREFPFSLGERVVSNPAYAGVVACVAGIISGLICACRFIDASNTAVAVILLSLVAGALVFVSLVVEKFLPASLTVSQAGLTSAVVALLLFSSSGITRLDLFSPLTMKVMKFTHDFVHQFFESMLIPDHLFIQANIWGYIGFLFGNQVGLWGGAILWLAPAVVVLVATGAERLPSVAHIRQGARRRKLLAAALQARRRRLAVPAIALIMLAGSIYRSRFPTVEYWDPKPLPISASPSGDIFIPKKGDVDLDDGKIHKYLFTQGGKQARFFVLMNPEGHLTVDLDACAICKPDGYGQAEGTVICYYCKTLIPLETVGKPGGCNPVPIHFTEKADGVHIDSLTLVNVWGNTVQATSRIKEAGK